MSYIFRLFLQDKKKLIVIFLLSIFSIVATLALPLIMSYIVDNGIYNKDYSYIVYACIVMAGISLVSFLLQVVAIKLSVGVSDSFNYKLRRYTFIKAQQLSQREFEKMGIGSLINRSTTDPNNMSWFFLSLMNTIFVMPIIVVTATVLSFRKDIFLSIVMFAFIPVVFMASFFIIRRIRPLFKRSDKLIDIQNGSMRERLLGIRIVRAFNKEDYEHEKIASNTMDMARAIITANRWGSVMHPFIVLVLNIVTIMILFISAIQISQPSSALSVGDVSAVMQYVSVALGSIVSGAYTLIGLPRVIESLKRINEVISTENPLESSAADDIQFSGELTLKNVSFSYPDASVDSIRNVDMHIKKGERVAVIGGTGSGKTTLAKLICGFYRPKEGTIFYDEHNAVEITPNTIRKNLSISMQKAAIFSGSIKENLAIGKHDATVEQMQRVAQIAQISSFIEEKENKYDYYLEQAGANLSGGQKQRLSIARTILKDAAIYIFDDSFSALDYLTEARLKAELGEYLKGKTQLIVTQRVASARNCDNIFVMDNGEIIASGKHSYLMENCVYYKEIYISQTGGAI